MKGSDPLPKKGCVSASQASGRAPELSERPVAVLERKVKRMWNKESSTEKVQGRESEEIWEQEAEMLEKYRDSSQIDFGDEIRISGRKLERKERERSRERERGRERKREIEKREGVGEEKFGRGFQIPLFRSEGSPGLWPDYILGNFYRELKHAPLGLTLNGPWLLTPRFELGGRNSWVEGLADHGLAGGRVRKRQLNPTHLTNRVEFFNPTHEGSCQGLAGWRVIGGLVGHKWVGGS
ncbi:LOW QUALITY PROTEIN: hypothetical protein OSB04_031847 [Centaurea solstitialis]|uniref:Uncharacterized protein n=1 Tax=Centaurea solstitialis TaxID=347529 RepID=A0AA38S9T0_9ASTR|nr:LOW QUALITY PROTEIN: hypothetical protein OSB04_031847 [Centaurea solstitialis]